MIPYKDENPSNATPWFVYLFCALNVLVFIYSISIPASYEQFIVEWGLVPARLFGDAPGGEVPAWAGLFTSVWLHGGILHLAGNVWFLWIFGDNVEDKMGHGAFVIFYLFCGTIAALAFALVSPDSNLPLVGASGAIAGVLGAYLRFYPSAYVRALLPIFVIITTVRVPAVLFIGLWLLAQVFGHFVYVQQTARGGDVGGVAYMAHLGGFVAGLLIALPFGRGEIYSRGR